jgi:hypothetical protein
MLPMERVSVELLSHSSAVLAKGVAQAEKLPDTFGWRVHAVDLDCVKAGQAARVKYTNVEDENFWFSIDLPSLGHGPVAVDGPVSLSSVEVGTKSHMAVL